MDSLEDTSSTYSSTKSDSSVLDDEVASTVSSVTDSLGQLGSVCGVHVTCEFLAHLDVLLRHHLHGYRLWLDREREVARVMNARKVRNISSLYDSAASTSSGRSLPLLRPRASSSGPPPPPPLPNSTTPVIANPSASGPLPTAPSANTEQVDSWVVVETRDETRNDARGDEADVQQQDIPTHLLELRHLRRQGLVSSIPTNFRSQLENIISVTAQSTPAPTPLRRTAPPTTAPTPPPPPPSSDQALMPPPTIAPPAPAYFETLLPSTPTPSPVVTPPSDPRFQMSPLMAETTSTEIAHLSYLQATSRVLSSRFRDNLEQVMRHHVSSRNLPPVRLNVRSRPRSPRPSSAFSQTSSPSPSGRRSSASHTDMMRLSGDVLALKAQMADMKQMMQQTMKLQMEMQRMMNHEVQAVFTAMSGACCASGPSAPISFPSPPTVAPTPQAGKCVVCVEQNSDAVLFRCGHQCMCMSCATTCKERGLVCPICRASVEDFVKCFPV